MAITATNFLYEVLVRFDENGIVGSHRIDMERVSDGQRVYSETLQAAQALVPSELPDLFSEHSALLVAQVADLQAQAVDLQAQVADLQAQVADLTSQVPSE